MFEWTFREYNRFYMSTGERVSDSLCVESIIFIYYPSFGSYSSEYDCEH